MGFETWINDAVVDLASLGITGVAVDVLMFWLMIWVA